MAPEIAMRYLDELEPGATVCDPMTGSGTVAALAVKKGLRAIAYDVDPLAALITTVRCIPPTRLKTVDAFWEDMKRYMERNGPEEVSWIDSCEETTSFVDYWFGPKQQFPMRRAARFLANSTRANAEPEVANVMRLALSRFVIRKTRGASLAWDVSHSRPHRVYSGKSYDFDVLDELEKSVRKVTATLNEQGPERNTCRVRIGDARHLKGVHAGEVDAILTSPPYLNAIDYLRGHRLSLVWLGLNLPQMRQIRGGAVGTEIGLESADTEIQKVVRKYSVDLLTNSQRRLVTRYSSDLLALSATAFRVLKDGGAATYVIGNNVLSGVALQNSKALSAALRLSGFQIISTLRREIPSRHRYLPVNVGSKNALDKRMGEEIVIRARKPKNS
jgi:DNA modification methylase